MNKNTFRWIITAVFVLVMNVIVLYGVFTETLDAEFKTLFIAEAGAVIGYWFSYQMKNKEVDDGTKTEDNEETKG